MALWVHMSNGYLVVVDEPENKLLGNPQTQITYCIIQWLLG